MARNLSIILIFFKKPTFDFVDFLKYFVSVDFWTDFYY